MLGEIGISQLARAKESGGYRSFLRHQLMSINLGFLRNASWLNE